MKKNVRYALLCVLLLLSISNLCAKRSKSNLPELSLTDKLTYTGKDYWFFMSKNRNDVGISFSYDWQNFPNAANKQWLSNMQVIGLIERTLIYPVLFEYGWRKHFGKINDSYQIPAFQSTKIDKDFGSFVSLSVFFMPYIPALKRTQEYIAPYAGIGYQWSSLKGKILDNPNGEFQLKLSSWYWKAGCLIFLSDYIPFDLYIEYARTLNPDKIRNYEWISIGITLRITSHPWLKKSYAKPLIDTK